MRFPEISKREGFLLSPLFISLYWLIYYWYNMYRFNTPPSFDDWSTRIFIVGAILHMMIYLETGGQLTWGTKRQNVYWSDGLCVVPNILHFTIEAFGFALFWGVKVDSEKNYDDQSRVDVLVHPLLATTRHNVQMSHLAATIDRGVTAFFLWFFLGWKSGEKHLLLMRFGFRLMLVGYILATINGSWNHGVQKTSAIANEVLGAATSIVNPAVQPKAPLPVPHYKTVTVSVQLDIGTIPIMPLKEDFVPTQEKDVRYSFVLEGRKYLRYFEPSFSKKESIWIEEPACALIPSGREVHLAVDRAPTVVVNMEDSVDYIERILPFDHTKLLDGLLTKPSRATWGYLHDNWKYAEANRHVLVVRAMKANDLPEPAGGGIVCF